MKKLREQDFVSVAIPNSLRIEIMIAAADQGKSINTWMQDAIKNALENSRKEREVRQCYTLKEI